MDEIKIGMYVRTKHGIGKVDETEMFMDKYFQFHLDSNKGRIHNVTTNTYWNSVEDIIGEPSDDPFKLIRPCDFVNGNEVLQVCDFHDGVRFIEFSEGRYISSVESIYNIVTREQYEREMYIVNHE